MEELNLDWRLKTSNGYTWRLARLEDMLRVYQLWSEQDARMGDSPRVDLMNMPVVLTLVAENASGEIVEALFGEATFEWISVGLERDALQTVNELFPALERFSAQRSVRVCRVNVPRRLARLVRRFLPGLRHCDEEISQFVFDVRP